MDKSVGDALAAAQRKAGGRRLTQAERDKVRADATAKFRAGLDQPKAKSQPTAEQAEQADKAAEMAARAKVEAKVKPVDGALGTKNPGNSGRVQANDGLWYPADQVEPVEPAADADPQPAAPKEGKRYGDENREVKAQHEIQKAMRDGPLDKGTLQAIAEATGVSASRVQQMHDDIQSFAAEDKLADLMAGGKAVGKAEYDAIAKELGVPAAKVRAAHKSLQEQNAFNALQDLKAGSGISPAALKKVAKDHGLPLEKVQELVGQLDNASVLADPDAEPKAPEPAPQPAPKPKKAPAKKAATPPSNDGQPAPKKGAKK